MNDFINKLNRMSKAIDRIPAKTGAEATRFFKERFTQESWIDVRTEPWKKRKRNNSKKRRRGILIKTGRLRRSIRIAYKSTDYLVIATDVPYAKAHNEGFRGTVTVKAYKRGLYKTEKRGTGVYNIRTRKEKMKTVTEKTGEVTVKSHKRKMNLPKRQFMGNSYYLSKKLDRIMQAEINRALKF